MKYDIFWIANAYGRLQSIVQSMGFRAETITDFARFEVMASENNPKPISTQFRDEYFDLRATNALAFALFDDRTSELVSLNAVRLDDIGQISLADHWDKQHKRIYQATQGALHAPGAYSITGKTVYQGDMFVGKAWRGQHVASYSSHMLMLLAVMQWQPDYVYCFVGKDQALRGQGIKYGFYCNEMRGAHHLTFAVGDEALADLHKTKFLCWNSAEHIAHWSRLICEGQHPLLSKQPERADQIC